MNSYSSAVDIAIKEMRRRSQAAIYKTDPVAWAADVLGKTLWSKQIEVAQSVRDNPRTAVRSCNNAGKTAIAGVLGAWWLSVHDPYETVVMCTAPGFAQIKTNLFHEFQTNYRAAKDRGTPLIGKINVSAQEASWKYDGKEIAFGRRPPDKDIVSYFQGVHRANQLIIIDEAGGLPRDMFTAAERVTTTGNARILAIGNPDHLGSEFHKMFAPNSDWSQIHISGFDTPNFTDEDFPDELRGFMLQPEWVERQRRVWGEEDARWKVSIMGEFPDADDTVFFPKSIINKAIGTEIERDYDLPVELGVDLAGKGDDSSVIYVNNGGNLRLHSFYNKAEAVEMANRVNMVALETGATIVKIDAGGLGAPIIQNLMTFHSPTYTIVEMNGSAATPDPRRWLNSRAMWYDNLREKMATGELDLNPEEDVLIGEMGDINYEITPKGSIQIESKKDLKARSGKSPDHLDAAVYAAADVSHLFGGGPKPGEKVYTELDEIIGEMPRYLQLMGGY